MIFSYALTYGVVRNVGWDVSYWFLLLLAILHTALLYGQKLAKKRKIPLLLVLSLLVLVCVILTLLRLPWFQYFWDFADYIGSWQGNGMMNLKYGWFILYMMLALGERLYNGLTKFIQTKLLLSILILGALILQACMYLDWDILPTAAALYVALSGFTETYQRLIQKRKEIFARDMLPFLAGVVLLLSVLPNSMDPISWNAFKQFYKQVQAGANELVCEIAFWNDDNGFTVGSVGFSNNQENFWGKLADGFSRRMMKISVNSGSDLKETYFTGVIKEKCNDNNWSKVDPPGKKELSEYQWEMQERLYNLYQSGILRTDAESFCKVNSYRLQYDNLKTNTLFYPTNCFQILPAKTTDQTEDDGPNILFQKKQKKGDIYQVDGMQMNLNQDNLVAYLQKKSIPKVDASTAKNTLFQECADALHLKPAEIAEITDASWKAKLESREKYIEQTDLELPDQLPSRVQSLAEKITAAKDNDFDKAQAIVHYLKETGGYTYTTSPAKLEEDKDVVDSFLFQSKKGYCSYFASAAAILCRCAGVPSRYVEGIVVDYEDETDGWYPVLGKSAHAWIQVYIQGFGWLDMDATPGYEIGGGNWKAQSNDYVAYKPSANLVQDTESKPTGDKKSDKHVTQFETVTSYVPYLAIGIGMILGSFFLVMIGGKAIAYHAYQTSGTRKRAEICMNRLLQYLKKRGLAMQSDETLRMYGQRLAKRKETDSDYLEVLQWYETVRYGNRKVAESEVLWLERICKQEKLRNRKIKREHRKWHVQSKKREV